MPRSVDWELSALVRPESTWARNDCRLAGSFREPSLLNCSLEKRQRFELLRFAANLLHDDGTLLFTIATPIALRSEGFCVCLACSRGGLAFQLLLADLLYAIDDVSDAFTKEIGEGAQRQKIRGRKVRLREIRKLQRRDERDIREDGDDDFDQAVEKRGSLLDDGDDDSENQQQIDDTDARQRQVVQRVRLPCHAHDESWGEKRSCELEDEKQDQNGQRDIEPVEFAALLEIKRVRAEIDEPQYEAGEKQVHEDIAHKQGLHALGFLSSNRAVEPPHHRRPRGDEPPDQESDGSYYGTSERYDSFPADVI